MEFVVKKLTCRTPVTPRRSSLAPAMALLALSFSACEDQPGSQSTDLDSTDGSPTNPTSADSTTAPTGPTGPSTTVSPTGATGSTVGPTGGTAGSTGGAGVTPGVEPS